MAWRLVVTFVIVTVALFVRDEIIYQTLIVPRPSSFGMVPIFLWGVSAAPVVVAFGVIGWMVRSFRDVVPHAATASLADHTWEYLSAIIFKAPATLKSTSTESPLFFWTLGLLLSFMFWGMCIGVVHGLRELFKSR
jgi:hypothetical protein